MPLTPHTHEQEKWDLKEWYRQRIRPRSTWEIMHIVDASGLANERMCYDHDRTLCIGTVIIERILCEKGNIIVLAHIELVEFHQASAKGTQPHWAWTILNTVCYL